MVFSDVPEVENGSRVFLGTATNTLNAREGNGAHNHLAALPVGNPQRPSGFSVHSDPGSSLSRGLML